VRSATAGCGDLRRIAQWRLVAERGMRPRRVVIGDPSLDRLPRVSEFDEQGLVQEFVPHLPVE